MSKQSTVSGPAGTYALAEDSRSDRIRSDDTAFDAGELPEFGSDRSIFTVYSDQPSQEITSLLKKNKIWEQGKIYSSTKVQLFAYKKALLKRYIDIPRILWRMVNDQLSYITEMEKGEKTKQ